MNTNINTNKTELTPKNKSGVYSPYDSYDYSQFWTGRDYEHKADVMALLGLLRRAQNARRHIIDVGGGMGRLTRYYADLYSKATIVDPSSDQLKKAKENVGSAYNGISFVKGIGQQLPFADAYADCIVCMRVSHHIKNIEAVIDESRRVLVPGGYFILEIANKLHFKAYCKSICRPGTQKDIFSEKPLCVNINNKHITFVNHSPRSVKRAFTNAGFKIVAIRSVSNFRSSLFKKLLPLSLLLFLERATQPILARWFFGPSIYFLVEKIQN